MIKTEILSPHILKIVAPKKLTSEDFAELTSNIDSLMTENANVRLIIDASHLEGWKNIAALEKHASFVKLHQRKVERIAVIVQYEWQHWMIGAVKVFLDPEIKVFDKGHDADALNWITG